MTLSNTTSDNADTATLPSDAVTKKRIASIDVMRGLVILLMMVDHVRERFFYHLNVSDPMDLEMTSPALFFTRMTAHLCAPTFVFLTGMAAWLYANPANKPPRSASSFLLKRGLFLVLIEITLVNFSWFGNFDTIWLQVIWAIGLSMIALSLMVKLPFLVIGLVGVVIVAGHNLLSPITFNPGETGYTLWAILHDRGIIFDGAIRIKASYPVLPWIGVILLGYCAGPLYARTMDMLARRKRLIGLGRSLLAILLLLRGFNIYGEVLPWQAQSTALVTLMDFINFTKYPPSLDFLLLTIGIALLMLAWFETLSNKFMDALEVFGSAPMFIYILHLYVLLISYRIALATVGPNAGDLFAFDYVWQIWAVTALLVWALYYPTRAFAKFKHSTTMAWVKYF
ncbi:MAG: DUF1624 domain-containing protein [Porticoccaceae bacterium]